MVTYLQLKREFEKKVTKLQETCNHKHRTEWVVCRTTSGQELGKYLQECARCRVLIKEREEIWHCNGCGQESSLYKVGFLSPCPLCGSNKIRCFFIETNLLKGTKYVIQDITRRVRELSKGNRRRNNG